MFIDSHCHLSDNLLLEQLEQILLQMDKSAVGHALCIGTTMADSGRVQQLAHQHDVLWASVGVHPEEDKEPNPTLDQLLYYAAMPRVIAIGETGLDYYQFQDAPREQLQWQRERFETHIEAARQSGLPLVIHTRSAADDTLAILKAAQQEAGVLRGVFHCFTETLEVAHAVLDLGFSISFSGILTFKNSLALREVAQQLPKDAVLIETDSPYLAPVPWRGKTNTPAYVPYVAAELAKLWQTGIEKVAEITTTNFYQLFTKAKNEKT